MAQGGLTASGTDGQAFSDEFNSQLTYDSPGLLGLANSGPDSNDEQWFITAIDAKGATRRSACRPRWSSSISITRLSGSW